MSGDDADRRIALRLLELEERSRILDAVVATFRGMSYVREPLPWHASDVAAELNAFLTAAGFDARRVVVRETPRGGA